MLPSVVGRRTIVDRRADCRARRRKIYFAAMGDAELTDARLIPACDEARLPRPGDYYVHGTAEASVLLVRQADGSVLAFPNVCPHRGARFALAVMSGTVRDMACPLHGWTWTLDGRLKSVPPGWERDRPLERDYAMARIAAVIRGGTVFVARGAPDGANGEGLSPSA